MKANERSGSGRLNQRQLTDIPENALTHIHQVTREQKHCVFTSSGAGLDFYYAMLAIHTVEYDGCEFEFLAVINTAGQRALEALDLLVDLRHFSQALIHQKYGLLVCLFYGLMTMIRLRNRAVSFNLPKCIGSLLTGTTGEGAP
jgi:hypothetical protein